MTHKHCFTIEHCEYRQSCTYGTADKEKTTQHFQPGRVGFHCDYYKSKTDAPWGAGVCNED